MSRYVIFDVYDDIENPDILNDNVTNMVDAYMVAYRQIRDTDGECNIMFKPYSPADVNPTFEHMINCAVTDAYDEYENEEAEAMAEIEAYYRGEI